VRSVRHFLHPPLSQAVCLLAIIFFATATFPVYGVERSGAELYTEMCVRCHGPNGEGVADKHDEPLNGDRSLKSLARVIQRTMPEDKDIKCTSEEAEKVAAYIYDKFYSPTARARMHPPRIDLARLTVSQYQNSVADLLASFSERREIRTGRGLKAEYYAARNFRGQKKVFSRTDPRVRFDFGTASPDPENELTDEEAKAQREREKKAEEEKEKNKDKKEEKKEEPEPIKFFRDEFAIKWSGSILAEETGDYEFRVKSQNGVRLFVNDDEKALIDAWVSSGPDIREHKETIRLLGGRAYPFKVDYFKYKEKAASVVVEWKPPHKAWEVIPQRFLSPDRVPETVVVATTFPADDGSSGYERGTSVSKAWDTATTQAAIGVASRVIDQLDRLSAAKSGDENRRDKVQQFCEKFVERAFRRPLTPEEHSLYIDAQFAAAKDVEAAVKRTVILALKSPRFLYPELPGHLQGDFLVASRLALNLWDSLPDRALREAAAKGQLHTSEEVAAQTSRMLQDTRTKTKLKQFFHHWLEMEEAEDLSKDPAAFPDFTDTLLADLRTSLELFIDEVVWSEKSDYRQLLKASYLYLNPRLATFYGAKLPPAKAAPEKANSGEEKLESEKVASNEAVAENAEIDQDTFHKVDFDPAQRVGVLTHPFLLSALAYYKSSSPIHRGVFLTRNIIGRALKPPPMAIQFMDGRFDPSLTMREKVTELTSPAACQGCHTIINPLGFSLEHFDGVGRFRTTDNNKPVNAVSDFVSDDGDTIRFSGARDVAEYAIGSAEAHRGFTRQLFQHLAKQPAGAYGAETLEKLRESFAASGFNIQKLIAEIATLTALHGLPEKSESGASIEKGRAAK
jgi:hypothetical protein